MNKLIVGANKDPILDHLPRGNFLVIDDGPLIDKLSVRARTFDPLKHTLNPLRDISYRSACDFSSLIEAAFPGGEETLTKQNTTMQVLTALLAKPESLETLIDDTKETKDAYNKIERLLLSPVLKPILTGSPKLNFSMKGTILARLDQAALGDFDCFVIGNLLISQYRGTVIIPDYSFYHCAFHTSLIRQNRLVAGIKSFDEVPNFRHLLVQIEEKYGSRTTPEDAKILAKYSGFAEGTNGYSDFMAKCIGG